MSAGYGKRKSKKKGKKDFKSYSTISQSLIPPAVFIATPRISGCAIEPLILRPIGLSEFKNLPSYQSFGTERSPSCTNTNTNRLEREDDADDAFSDRSDADDECRMSMQRAFVSAALRSKGDPVVGPPDEFRDYIFDNYADDRSIDDASLSYSFRPKATFSVPHEEDVAVMPATSLQASLADPMSETRLSEPRLRHTARSQADEPPRSLRSTREPSSRAQDPMLESQTIDMSISHTNRSSIAPLQMSSNDLRASGSLSKMPQTLQKSGDHHQSLRQSLRSMEDGVSNKQDDTLWVLQERIRELEIENRRKNEYIEAQKNDLPGYGKMREDADALVNVSSHKLREEMEALKTIVHRLNTELDIYHKKFRKLTTAEMDEIASLPLKGPKPSWLVNMKYLSPLLVAYDDQLKEKEFIIETYENKLELFQQKVDEILKENSRLHIRLEQTDAVGPISMTEWKQLQEQCRLVLEENQLLMEQLDLQQNKEKDMRKTFMHETSKLTQKACVVETEKTLLQLEVNEVHEKMNDLKHKYEEAVVDNCSKLNMEEHINALSAIRQNAQEEKVKHIKDMDELSAKLKAVEVEKGSCERELDRTKNFVKELETDIRNKIKAEKKYKKEIEYLQMSINDNEMLTAKVRLYLANVLKTAEVTAKERDSLAVSVQEQEKAKTAALKKLINESVDLTKIKEKIKAYNTKKKEKLDKMANRLKQQDNSFNIQRQEYEREIKHLQQLVHDKDEMVNVERGEKKMVMEDLETMWQAATNENQRMQETIRQTNRKLQDHVSLRTRMIDDPEPSTLLDQMLKQCGCDN